MSKRLARDRVGAHDRGGIGASVFLRAPRERRTHAVHHAVGGRSGDDLATQPMLVQVPAEALLHDAREIALQFVRRGTDPPARRNRSAASTAPSWRRRAGSRAPVASGRGRPCVARRSPPRSAGIPARDPASRTAPASGSSARARADRSPRASPASTAPGSAGSCRAVPVPPRLPSCRPAAGCASASVSPARFGRLFSRILMLTSWSEQSTPPELSTKSVFNCRRPPRTRRGRAATGRGCRLRRRRCSADPCR